MQVHFFFKCVNSKPIFDIISKHPTFDYEFIDPFTENTLLMFCCITEHKFINTILKKNTNIINEVNNKKENALIIATKFNYEQSVNILLKKQIICEILLCIML